MNEGKNNGAAQRLYVWLAKLEPCLYHDSMEHDENPDIIVEEIASDILAYLQSDEQINQFPELRDNLKIDSKVEDYFDSFSIVKFIKYIEQKYNIEFSIGDINSQVFMSSRTIAQKISQYIN